MDFLISFYLMKQITLFSKNQRNYNLESKPSVKGHQQFSSKMLENSDLLKGNICKYSSLKWIKAINRSNMHRIIKVMLKLWHQRSAVHCQSRAPHFSSITFIKVNQGFKMHFINPKNSRAYSVIHGQDAAYFLYPQMTIHLHLLQNVNSSDFYVKMRT